MIVLLVQWKRGAEVTCDEFLISFPEKAVELVEQWAAENPRKTRLKDFMEKYPKAALRADNMPVFCYGYLSGERGAGDACTSPSCSCYECWNQKAEEKDE